MMSVNNALQRIFLSNFHSKCKIRHLCSVVPVSGDNNQDVLIQKLKYASSTKEVLDTFSQHKDVMNSKHLLRALRSIFILQKDGRSELSTKSILASKKFSQLCGKLKSVAGTIDYNETIDALKFVSYIGVPKNSTIVQVLLQMLRHNVNDLSLQQIIFLDFLLGHYEGVPLAEALKIALPIVFDIQLSTKLEHENIESLKEYLQFVSKHQISDKSIDLILSKILNCKDKYNGKLARSFLWSLTDLKPRPCFETLIEKNVSILVRDFDEVSFNVLDITLKKLANSYTEYALPYYRNTMFCDAIARYVIEKDIGFKESIYVVKKLFQLSVTSRDLIDHVSDKCEEEINHKMDSFYNYHILLKYLTKTDHRPKNWDYIRDEIKKISLPKSEYLDMLKAAVVLGYHQIFNEALISQLFDQDFINNPLKISVLNSYVTLYQTIKLYRPDLIPNKFKPEDFIDNMVVPKDFPFQKALFSAFGGENYVKSGWLSKEGIFIDHAIVFRKGGYPVSMNSTCKFIEDQNIPVDNEMVLIMCLMPEAYTEENYLRRSHYIRLKLLEELGYSVVPICWESWKSLLDHEKIPYLVQNVKNKLGQEMILNSYA